jgi:hypothetical protein
VNGFGNVGSRFKCGRNIEVSHEDVTRRVLEPNSGHEDFDRSRHGNEVSLSVSGDVLVPVERVEPLPILEQLGHAVIGRLVADAGQRSGEAVRG